MKKFIISIVILFLTIATVKAQSSYNFFIVSSGRPISNEVKTYITKEKVISEYEAIDFNMKELVNDRVNLSFLNNIITLNKDKIESRSSEDFSWFGSNDDKNNQGIITIKDKDIQGIITIGNALYRILTINGTYIIGRIDQSKFMPEGCNMYGETPNEEQKDTTNRNFKTKRLVEDLPTEGNKLNKTYPEQAFWNFECKLRVLVLYTTASKNAHGSIENHIRLAIDEMNQSFINSGVNYQAELVYMEETSYTESNNDELDLQRFTLIDGFMDNIHNLKEAYSADVCVLIAELTDYCGIAAAIKSCSDRSFCIVHSSCATGNFTFAHEIGHLIGARHDPSADPSNTPYAFGHGFIGPSNSYRTIMGVANSCGNCTRIQWWSNPNQIRNGQPMGTQASHDNARLLNEYIPNVMSHRPLTGIRYVTQTDIHTSVGVIYHANRIETLGNINIPSGYAWGFIAGNEVSLNTGFETDIGSYFEAKIHPQCGITDNEPCNFATSFDEKHDKIDIESWEYILFPNPVISDYFTIDIIGDKNISVEFEIINSVGQIVSHKKFIESNQRHDFSEFPSGVYFVKLYNSSGTIKTIKFIKL